VLSPLVSETLIFLVSLVFNLIYQRDIQSGMLLVFQNDSARQIAKNILKDIRVHTSIYFGTLTVVNICLGIATTAMTWLVGLPHPFLWGMLAAVMNFIPYLGAAIVIATLFVVGLIAFSALSHAVIAPLAYLGITLLEGQVITPTLIGHRLTINPFLVFSPSQSGPGCGDRSARSWACPFSCAGWWRCVGCHRQAARTPAYTRLWGIGIPTRFRHRQRKRPRL